MEAWVRTPKPRQGSRALSAGSLSASHNVHLLEHEAFGILGPRHGLEVFEGIDLNRLVEMFLSYLALSEQKISRAQAQQRMFAKMANPRLLLDMRPLLPAAEAESLTDKSTFGAIQRIFADLVDQLPGDPWARTEEMKERFEIDW